MQPYLLVHAFIVVCKQAWQRKRKVHTCLYAYQAPQPRV